MPFTALFLAALLLAFVGTVLLTRKVIPILREKKMGQKILEIGPRWHKNKEGTPTMGGICFIIPILFTVLVVFLTVLKETPRREAIFLLLTLLYGILNAIVGIIDDLTKFKKKRNDGLTPRQKLLLQTVFAAAYLAMLALFDGVSTTLRIPFTQLELSLGGWYYAFALLLLVGIVNCANLTDGIDGLAASEAAILAAFFGIMGALRMQTTSVILSGAILGGALAFLIFNYHPARLFMGDTGSLFFGAILAGSAFLLGEPLLILTAGMLYVLEGTSVILQVLFFRLTKGKRLFKMAPLHHHFEKSGWSEVRIVSVFSLVTFLFCFLSYKSIF